MSKTVWTKEKISEFIESVCALRKYSFPVELTAHEQLIFPFEITGDRRQLRYVLDFFNHPDMSDDIIRSCLVLVVEAYNLEKEGRLYHSELEKACMAVCRELGCEYIEIDSLEEFLRPVRRQLYPGSPEYGCYFHVGDILRCRPELTGGPCRYVITGISGLTDEGIMISFTKRDDPEGEVFTEEEAEVYRRFMIMDF